MPTKTTTRPQLLPPRPTDLPGAHTRAAQVERRVLRAVFKPAPRMTTTQWADSFRFLSAESSAEVGKYSSDRAPYQKGPMDALSDPRTREVVMMFASQTGKTEIINNFVGKRIHLEPGPMLVVQPTLPMADAWSKDRLAPMVRDTPVLRGRVKDARSRNSDNTILHKKFPGGHITIAGANSPSSLASRPIRDVLADEIDRFPASAGAEGDPIGLADRRTTTFANRKLIRASTPTIKGRSAIEKEYADSTQEKWHVPCPHCAHAQILRWGGVDVPYGIKWDAGHPESAHYVCESCACVIEESWKTWMNARGRWIADNPGHPARGFWLNALVSPWAKWGDLVREWLEVKNDEIRLRQFINTVFAETWEDKGAQLDAHVLFNRLEKYPAVVPNGVGVLVRSADTQDDRIETVVWGWGAGEEGWFIEHELIPGDPGIPFGALNSPWNELEAQLGRSYAHESGATLAPLVTFIDAGGHHAKEVYQFCRQRANRRVFAIHGATLEGAPLLGKPTRNNAAKTILYPVGSFTGKESVMARFGKVKEPGPGYLHLPDFLDSEQLNQFTNEKLVTRIVGGRPKRIWIVTGRNEQLDLLVYALAALHVLGPATLKNLGEIAKQVREKGEALRARQASGEEPKPPDDPPPRNWVTGWRR